jgi:hypothetical protein
MFRIAFDYKTSCFIVQVLEWWLFWRTCLNRSEGAPIQFETYAEVRCWVDSIGLSDAFVEQESKKVYS